MENTENTANDNIDQVEAGVEKLNDMFDELDAGLKADQAGLNRLGRTTPRRFTPNDVLKDFMVLLEDKKWCLDWIIWEIHGVNYSCPSCGRPINDNLIARYFDAGRIKCSACGTFFTALSGTFLSGVHFDCRQIIAMCLLMALGISDRQISEIVGINKESVRLWRKKFNDTE